MKVIQSHAWSPTLWSGYSKMMVKADMTIIVDPSCGLPPETAIMLAGLMRMKDIYIRYGLVDPHLASFKAEDGTQREYLVCPPIKGLVQHLVDGDVLIIRCSAEAITFTQVHNSAVTL